MVPGLLITLVAGAMARGEAAEPWPSFLPAPTTMPQAIAAGVEQAWTRPTLTRHIDGERAHAPFDLYVALIDAPEVTALASRHLRLAPYAVRRLGPGWYHADDGMGAQGEYHVLARERTRRVMFSRGRHGSRFFGAITGVALTDLRFEPQGGYVAQRLSAWLVIDNRFAAVVARLLIPFFGQVADRKLQEGFRVTARVAEWAASRPAEFCPWLGGEASLGEARQPVLAAAGCPKRARPSP
jgi:hypothetical protein